MTCACSTQGKGVIEENCASLLKLANTYETKNLEKACGCFLAKNFADMWDNERDKLLGLSVSTWAGMLDSDELKTPYVFSCVVIVHIFTNSLVSSFNRTEEYAYHAVITYSNMFEGKERDKVLTELLPQLVFPAMSGRFLVETVEADHSIAHLPVIHHLLFHTYRYKMLPALHKNEVMPIKTKMRGG